MKSDYIPIVRSSGLYLIAIGHGNDNRFARVFRETWQQIPLAHRRRMVKHWAEWRIDGWKVPVIELLHDKSDWYRGANGDAIAQCTLAGRTLSFWADWVDRLPDEHLPSLIAHELAHVYHLATDPKYHEVDDSISEEDAFELLSYWGFDEDARIQWQEANLQDLIALREEQRVNRHATSRAC